MKSSLCVVAILLGIVAFAWGMLAIAPWAWRTYPWLLPL